MIPTDTPLTVRFDDFAEAEEIQALYGDNDNEAPLGPKAKLWLARILRGVLR